MKTVLGVSLGLMLALTSYVQAQNTSVTQMTDQLVAQSEASSRSAPRWNALLSRYQFVDAQPLSDVRAAPGLEGYKITHTMYGAQDDVFPSVFVVYKGETIVAFLGLENRTNEATTTTDGYPILYTAQGKKLPTQEKKQFETWFYSWLNSVN